MFEGIRSLQVARNKVQTLVEMLKNRSLLMDSSFDRGHVKMHDVIRDVGIFIAVKEGLMDPNISWNSWLREENNCSWISLFHHGNTRVDFPGGSVFPKLSFLLIEGEHSLSDDFFESSRKLHVLSISNYTLRSLPHTIQLLKTLRTLILVNCGSLEDLSVVGELVSLEILCCQRCPLIKELPVEIGRLNQLKLLHIWGCRNLKTIAAGVISRLIRLEELTLMDSFKNWESGALCELNSLSNLTTLRIEIKDASLAAQQIHVPNVVEFSITVGEPLEWRFKVPRSYEREMNLEVRKEVIIGDWIHQLLRTTQSLHLHGQGSSKLLPIIFPRAMGNNSLFRLESLRIESCSMLWNEEKNEQTSCVITFPKLKEVILKDLPRLTNLCKGIESIEFPLLKKMEIVRCPNLKSVVSSTENDDSLHLFCKDQATFGRLKYLSIEGYDSISSLWCDQIPIYFYTGLVHLRVSNCGNIKSLFSPPIAENLVNLTVLTIKNCHEMVKVIDDEEAERSPLIKLEMLVLMKLPELKAFCDWRWTLELPSLIRVDISECPKMEKFSFGSLTTPNLEKININYKNISDRTKDLNDVVGEFLHL